MPRIGQIALRGYNTSREGEKSLLRGQLTFPSAPPFRKQPPPVISRRARRFSHRSRSFGSTSTALCWLNTEPITPGNALGAPATCAAEPVRAPADSDRRVDAPFTRIDSAATRPERPPRSFVSAVAKSGECVGLHFRARTLNRSPRPSNSAAQRVAFSQRTSDSIRRAAHRLVWAADHTQTMRHVHHRPGRRRSRLSRRNLRAVRVVVEDTSGLGGA